MKELNIPIIDVNGVYSEGVYNCGTTFLNSFRNASPDAIMKCISETDENDFHKYCEGIKKLGFNQLSSRRIDDNIFSVFECAEEQMFISYEPKRARINIVLDSLSSKERNFSYSLTRNDGKSAEFYMYGLNLDPQGYDTYNKLNTSGYTNCGMLFVIKCIDNSLIIVDGGEESSFSEQDIDKLNDFLHRVAKKNTDEKIRICCWYLTHAHSDHLRGFFKLMYKHGNQYELERIISNLPDFEKYGGQPVEEMQTFSQFVKKLYPNCKDMKAHVGQKLQLADISIDVLCTHECIVDAQTLDTKKNDLNDRSLVLKFSSGGVSFLMLGDILYHYVGKWRESHKRFSNGVKATLDYIKSLNMKPGLWIEPESVGWKSEIIDYYNDDTCFFCRYGKPVVVHNRRFLDYRHPKVIEYMTDSIRYMVELLGAEYVKLDFNQDCAVGTEVDAISFGEGLECAARAYLDWVDSLRKEYPDVIFETCSSGGMRMDYGTLSHFSIVSTSDQISYKKYPYIVGNVLSCVLPEQAAVWSYPVDSKVEGFAPTSEWVNQNVSNEQIIMNMINGFLGRMHLSSHIELLNEDKIGLVRDGIEYYNSLKDIKKIAVPYMPLGFTRFGSNLVASGLLTKKRLYLAVWNLDGELDVDIPLYEIKPLAANIAYPKSSLVEVSLNGDILNVNFTDKIQAIMLEIEL